MAPVVELRPAAPEDAPLLHRLKVEAFTPLLERYRDVDTNPACEPLEKTTARLEEPGSDCYVILLEGVPVGGVRTLLREGARRISPIFLVPACQGKGVGREAMRQLEALYPEAERWSLETIEQEANLCRFYESLGYRRTGKREQIQEGMTLIGYEKTLERMTEHGSL